MTTRAQIAEAHRGASAHRLHMMKLAKVNEAVATPDDMVLVAEVQAITTPDAMDKALAREDVDGLLRRGVLFFGRDG